ncbi:MAG TPA: hypothetical protein VNO70_02010 [Blastocatellia bacterium]|nr:hypothetical protein [Blastocatellia bacterium]
MRCRTLALAIILAGCAAVSWAGHGGESPLTATAQARLAHLNLSTDDLRKLNDKEVIVQALPARSARQMAGFGALLADAPPATFVELYRNLEVFDQSPYILASGRFSAPPNLEDLKNLTIDDKDLYALAKSRPGDSDVKLSEPEIARFQALAGSAPRLTPKLKAQLAAEYKKMMVERVKDYLRNGAAALGSFADKEKAIGLHEAFVALAREQAGTAGHCEHLYSYLEKYPEGAAPDTESFIYWAKQKFGSLKPVINLVHVVIHREGERVYIASKQIYSSHYTEAALSVAELIPFAGEPGQPRTVVAYSIRLQTDMLGGAFSFMKKRMAQPRMLGMLKASLAGLRLHMEAMARASVQTKAGL